MKENRYPGIGAIENMIPLTVTEDSSFTAGKDGVKEIFTPLDRKVEFIVFENKTLCNV